MRITAIKAQRNNPDRVNLFVDGEFRCGIAAELVYASHLRVGELIDANELADLERRDLRWKSREAALNLLSYRARTAAELRRRLRQKDYPDDVVETCVDDLVERGLVDDAEFAAAFVRDRVRSRPRGARRLIQELRARGVDYETAQRVVRETLAEAGADEIDLAREAASTWARRSPEPARDASGQLDEAAYRTRRRRLYGFLARRGFAGEVIHTVMEEVLARHAD